MISITEITKTLDLLDRYYLENQSNKNALLYSKLAVLELCGWIEEAMDDVVQRSCKRKIKDERFRKEVDLFIKNTYGFEYQKHFRPMVVQVIGYSNFAKVERKIDALKLEQFLSALANLKNFRHQLAHTHSKGVTASIPAPSVIKNNFIFSSEGIREFEIAMRKLRF